MVIRGSSTLFAAHYFRKSGGGISSARKIASLCEFFPESHRMGMGRATPRRGPRRPGSYRSGHDQFRHPGSGNCNEASPKFSRCPGKIEEWDDWCNENPGLGIRHQRSAAAQFPIRDEPPFDLQWGRSAIALVDFAGRLSDLTAWK